MNHPVGGMAHAASVDSSGPHSVRVDDIQNSLESSSLPCSLSSRVAHEQPADGETMVDACSRGSPAIVEEVEMCRSDTTEEAAPRSASTSGDTSSSSGLSDGLLAATNEVALAEQQHEAEVDDGTSSTRTREEDLVAATATRCAEKLSDDPDSRTTVEQKDGGTSELITAKTGNPAAVVVAADADTEYVEQHQQQPSTTTNAEEDNRDRFHWDAPKHIFVLSTAGKPVFSLSGDEQSLSTLMGLIQGLLSLCIDCGDEGGDDEMESISTANRQFVFLRRGDLVLVAVSSSTCFYREEDGTRRNALGGDGDGGAAGAGAGAGAGAMNGARHESGRGDNGESGCGSRVGGCFVDQESETFLRLQLEYMYASIVFLLTSKVQAVLRRSPGYDLRGLLGGADTSLKGITELAEPARGRGRMLAGGVETVWMDPAIRAKLGSALQTAQSAAAGPSALYAIWLCGEKLIALAQPRAPAQRLHSQDLLLLVNFVATQPALRTAESWTPVCFPRFQEQGYLYAYIAFLDNPERPAAEQGNDSSSNDDSSTSTADNGSTEDQPRQPQQQQRPTRTGDSCLILVSAEASAEQFQAFRRARTALESRFRSTLGLNWDRYLGAGASAERESILKRFCSQLNALHFFYCLRGRRGGAPCVNQVMSSPFAPTLAGDHGAQRRIWGHYTRAALRLRRGSSQEGRVFSRDGENGRAGGVSNGGTYGFSPSAGDQEQAHAGNGGSGRVGSGGDASGFAEATAIFEADPVHSLVYEIGATETFVSLFGQRDDGSGGSRWSGALSGGGGGVGRGGSGGDSWGERDELHVCFPSGIIPVEQAYKAAVRLVAIIRRDREWLFLTGTGASK